MSRTVDRTKKSNIKCDHCKFFERADYLQKDWCCLHQVNKNYWNRCKDFEWRGDV